MMKLPPPKRAGSQTGPRRLAGAVLDVASVAEVLGTNEATVRSRIARGMLPARRLGGRVVVLRAELEAWLAALPRVVERT